MNIIKFPKDLDPNTLIEKEIDKKYKTVCPFCNGNNNSISRYETETYKTNPNKKFNLLDKLFGDFHKPKKWKRKIYWCEDCKAMWGSDWYPEKIYKEEEEERKPFSRWITLMILSMLLGIGIGIAGNRFGFRNDYLYEIIGGSVFLGGFIIFGGIWIIYL